MMERRAVLDLAPPILVAESDEDAPAGSTAPLVPLSRECGPLCDVSLGELASLSYSQLLNRARESFVRAYLIELMRATRGVVTEAARHAGIERESMHRLLRRHGIPAAGYRV